MKNIWIWVIVIVTITIFGIILIYMIKESSDSKTRLAAINTSVSNIGSSITTTASSGTFWKILASVLPEVL